MNKPTLPKLVSRWSRRGFADKCALQLGVLCLSPLLPAKAYLPALQGAQGLCNSLHVSCRLGALPALGPLGFLRCQFLGNSFVFTQEFPRHQSCSMSNSSRTFSMTSVNWNILKGEGIHHRRHRVSFLPVLPDVGLRRLGAGRWQGQAPSGDSKGGVMRI